MLGPIRQRNFVVMHVAQLLVRHPEVAGQLSEPARQHAIRIFDCNSLLVLGKTSDKVDPAAVAHHAFFAQDLGVFVSS